MKQFIALTLLLSALLVIGREIKTDTPRVRRDKVTVTGATQYHLGYENGWATIDLLDRHSAKVARVQTRQDVDGTQLISLAKGDENFLIVFDPGKGDVELRDSDGVTYSKHFDQKTRNFISSPGASERFDLHYNAIALAIETIDDLRTQKETIVSEGASPTKRHVTTLMIDETPGDSNCPPYADCDLNVYWNTLDGSAWFMDGYWFWGGSGTPQQPKCFGPTVVGDSEGNLMRSVACAKAANDANTKCWNQYCTGCCRLLECDYWCAAGTYLCTLATVVGQACSAP